MYRSIFFVILSFVSFGSSKGLSQEQTRVAVTVYNDARVSTAVVKRAQDVAGNIYRRAGVVITWRERGQVPANSVSVSETRGRNGVYNGGSIFSLRIVSHSLSLRNEEFGVAFVGNDGLGVQADIFYSCIEQLQRSSRVDAGEILGHVMAHELGHLLLGPKSHSNTGIMQARWERKQLHQLAMGCLGFDRREAATIRTRLLNRYASLRNDLPASKPTLITALPQI